MKEFPKIRLVSETDIDTKEEQTTGEESPPSGDLAIVGGTETSLNPEMSPEALIIDKLSRTIDEVKGRCPENYEDLPAPTPLKTSTRDLTLFTPAMLHSALSIPDIWHRPNFAHHLVIEAERKIAEFNT